jgi:hypothetical protein
MPVNIKNIEITYDSKGMTKEERRRFELKIVRLLGADSFGSINDREGRSYINVGVKV